MPKFFWQVYQNWNQSVTMTFFESDVETAFRLSDGTYWGRFYFERVAISHVSCLLDFIVFGKSSEKFGSVVENGIHKSWDINWRRKILQETWKYLIIILLEQLNLGLSGQENSARLPKLVFPGQVRQSAKIFFRNHLLFTTFSVFQSTFSGLSAQNFRQVCQNRIFSVRRIFRRPGDIFLTVLSEMHSTCPVELFWGLFWKNCNVTKVLDLIISFQCFLKNFRQPCPNCHLRVLRNILKEKMVRKTWNFQIIN